MYVCMFELAVAEMIELRGGSHVGVTAYLVLELRHLSYPVVVDDSLSICRIQSVQGSLQMKAGMADYPCEMFGQDKDIGGAGNYYLIFVENLEKDLTPLSIMEFVHEEVSIACQAIVCRSLSSELCTQGNILLDSKKNFEKLCDFMENPDRIVVSFRGRPWLSTEKISVHDTVRASVLDHWFRNLRNFCRLEAPELPMN